MEFYKQKNEVIIIPDNVVEIERYTFNNCSEIKRIIIPESVLKINSSAFARCRNLIEVSFSYFEIVNI